MCDWAPGPPCRADVCLQMYENSTTESPAPGIWSVEKGCHLHVRTCSASWCGWNNNVLEFSRETEPMGYVYMKRFIMRNWLSYGGWDVPPSAICKLASRKAGGASQYKSKALRTRSAAGRIPAQKIRQEGLNSAFFCLFVLFRSSVG